MMSSRTDNVNSSNGNGSNNMHSLLDRTIPIVLPRTADADLDQETPSRKQGVSVRLERLHRLQGTSLISMGIHILQQQQQPSSSVASHEPTTASTAAAPISYSPTSWYASACTIFHRYYHGVSLIERDVWSVAMAATLIAAKLEEIPLTVRQLIIVYAHLYTRRRHVVMNASRDKDDDDDNAMIMMQNIINHAEVLVAPGTSVQSSSSRRQTISTPLTPASVQALSPTGPIWKEWHEALLQTESSILRQLGFVLHWIPNRHVHKFMYAFLHVLQITSPPAKAAATTTTSRTAASNPSADDADADDDDDRRRRRRLAQGAWNYCNLSYRLDLCVRYEAAVIACAAIYLAALDLGLCDVDHDLHVVKSSSVSNSSNGKTATTKTTINSRPWWKILLLGTAEGITDHAQAEKTATDLVQIGNTLAGLASVSSASVSVDASSKGGRTNDSRNGDDTDAEVGVDQNQLDMLVASVAFLKPLNPDSFHGPDSFVWEMANRHDAAAAASPTTTDTNLR